MNAYDKGNPRVVIHDTDLERTLRYMEVLGRSTTWTRMSSTP